MRLCPLHLHLPLKFWSIGCSPIFEWHNVAPSFAIGSTPLKWSSMKWMHSSVLSMGDIENIPPPLPLRFSLPLSVCNHFMVIITSSLHAFYSVHLLLSLWDLASKELEDRYKAVVDLLCRQDTITIGWRVFFRTWVLPRNAIPPCYVTSEVSQSDKVLAAFLLEARCGDGNYYPGTIHSEKYTVSSIQGYEEYPELCGRVRGFI